MGLLKCNVANCIICLLQFMAKKPFYKIANFGQVDQICAERVGQMDWLPICNDGTFVDIVEVDIDVMMLLLNSTQHLCISQHLHLFASRFWCSNINTDAVMQIQIPRYVKSNRYSKTAQFDGIHKVPPQVLQTVRPSPVFNFN